MGRCMSRVHECEAGGGAFKKRSIEVFVCVCLSDCDADEGLKVETSSVGRVWLLHAVVSFSGGHIRTFWEEVLMELS